MLDDGGVYRTWRRRLFESRCQIWVLGVFGKPFKNIQKLHGHYTPGFPYFRTGSRFDVTANSLDTVVFPVASNPMTD